MAHDIMETILKGVPITEVQKNMFLNYLCSENGSYLTYREVGELYGTSKQRVHQVVDRYSKYLNILHRDKETLGTLYLPIGKMLRKHKGAISISSFIEDNKDAYELCEVTLRRMLRFASTVSKLIDIDVSKDLFWESKSPCIKCRFFTNELQSHKHEEDVVLEEIDNFCKTIDCKHRQNRTFDKGQLDLHVGMPKHISEVTSIVSNPIDITKYNTNHKINSTLFSQKQHQMLEFILSKGAKVPKIGLEAFCRIKRIDLNAELNTINDAFYKKHERDLLVYDSSDENWELSDTGLPLILQINTEKPIDQIDKNLSEEDKSFQRHVTMLKNTLNNSNKSYKFYWALAILHCIERDIEVVEKNYLAALMCSYAWNDVLITMWQYHEKDMIPETVRRIYSLSRVQKHAAFEDILEAAIRLVGNRDVINLVRSVSIYFNETYQISSAEVNNESEIHASTHLYYAYEKSIRFNAEVAALVRRKVPTLVHLVMEEKKQYFERVNKKEVT